MPDNPGVVDEAGVAAFLAERFGREVKDVVPVQRGEWSKALFFRRAGRDYVARFGAYLEDFEKDRLAVRYRAPDLPIPSVVEVGEAFGGHFAISERLFGEYIDGTDEAQMRVVLPSLFAALDAMRRANLAGTTGYGAWGADGTAPFPSWQAFLLDVGMDRPTDRIAGWRQALAGSSTGVEPFDEAYRRLQELAAYSPAERHLIHSDLLHFNVLVEADRVTAIFDWGCGLYGDFLYDLAWLCFWSPWYEAWRAIDFRQEALRQYAAIGLEVPHFEERLLACQIHIGLGGQAYQAYKGYWPEMEWTVRRTLDVTRGGS